MSGGGWLRFGGGEKFVERCWETTTEIVLKLDQSFSKIKKKLANSSELDFRGTKKIELFFLVLSLMF